MKINGPNMTAKILEEFPEIQEYFGEEFNFNVTLRLRENGTEEAVRFETERGVVIGSTDDDVVAYLQFVAQNATMPQPFVAAEFQMNLEVALNASFSNFLIEAEFTETTVANTRMTYNYIGLPSEDYNTLM